jgi:hypothetical protein
MYKSCAVERSILAVCFLYIMLFAVLAYAFSNLGSINKLFINSHFFISNILHSTSLTTSTSDSFLTSFLSVAHSFSYKNNVENINGSSIPNNNNNNNNIQGELYDDFEDGNYTLSDGHISPNGKWKIRYTGYGSAGVEGSIKNNYFFEQPKPPTQHNETRASLVTTTKGYSDFQMTLNMRTLNQLRQNGPPNPWETAWIYWHYTDNYHYYALVLKTNGFQIEKKDNNNHDDSAEIYLVDQSHPKVKLGQWQTVTIRHEGSSTGTPHTQVWVDGIKAADFIDSKIPNSYKMSSGYMGLYNEDAKVNFDNIYINAIK